MSISLIFAIVALVLFFICAINIPTRNFNTMAWGLVFLTLAFIFSVFGVSVGKLG